MRSDAAASVSPRRRASGSRPLRSEQHLRNAPPEPVRLGVLHPVRTMPLFRGPAIFAPGKHRRLRTGGLAMDAYDVIIVGTGAGGGTLARHLAPSRKRILLLERGDWLPREPSNWLAQDVF